MGKVQRWHNAYQLAGYQPIECSFGTCGSVLGPLALDHHGTESWREGVALRAYRDHYSACEDAPRFVVTGAPDADATFAIAALAGLLPHLSRADAVTDAPEPVKQAMVCDLTPLATLINRRDTDPIGLHLEATADGALLLLWEQLASAHRDATAFYGGVDRWRALLARGHPALLDAARQIEADCVAAARAAIRERISAHVLLVESDLWGFDVWYAWAPVIVVFVPKQPTPDGSEMEGSVSVGVRDRAVAVTLFGPGGLKNVFPRLQPPGWGRREAVGGGPRGVRLTRAQARAAAQTIASACVATVAREERETP